MVSLMQQWASVTLFLKKKQQTKQHLPTACFDSCCKGEKPYEMLYGSLEFVCFMVELSTGNSSAGPFSNGKTTKPARLMKQKVLLC